MAAEVLKLDVDASERAGVVERAASLLAGGGLVVFPTETVYGVAANAADGAAVERLRAVKGRAGEQPFTVHVGSREDAEAFLVEPSALGRRLMSKGWPGPLTLLFGLEEAARTAAHGRLSDAGRAAIFRNNSVGLRLPDEANTAELLRRAGVPVIASSANRAGRPAPVDAAGALAELGGDVELVLDGGRARYGRPSTIVSVNGSTYRMMREGVFDARTIRRLATLNILFVCTGNTCRSPMAEGLCRDILARRLGCRPEQLGDRGVAVASCGVSAAAGMPASAHAVELLRARGVEIGGHRSQPASATMLRSADHVFAMTEQHRRTALELAPEAAARVVLLDGGGDIEDPVGGDEAEYAACAERIAAKLEQRLREVPL